MTSSGMMWLDWLILAIVAYNVVSGLFAGFLRSLINLVALVVAYLLTPVVKVPLSAVVQSSLQLPAPLALPLGSFLAFTLVYVAISLLGMILSKVINMTPLAIVDRIGGAAFGLFVSALLILVPLAGIRSLPYVQSITPLQQILKSSQMVTLLQPAVGFVQVTAGPAILNYWFKSSDQKAMSEHGTQPSAKPGTSPGTKPGTKPGATTGPKPGLRPGTLPGSKPTSPVRR